MNIRFFFFTGYQEFGSIHALIFIHPFPSIPLSIYSFRLSSIGLFIRSSHEPLAHSSIHSFMDLSISHSLSIYRSIYLSIHSLIHFFIHPSLFLSIYPFIPPSIYPFISRKQQSHPFFSSPPFCNITDSLDFSLLLFSPLSVRQDHFKAALTFRCLHTWVCCPILCSLADPNVAYVRKNRSQRNGASLPYRGTEAWLENDNLEISLRQGFCLWCTRPAGTTVVPLQGALDSTHLNVELDNLLYRDCSDWWKDVFCTHSYFLKQTRSSL